MFDLEISQVGGREFYFKIREKGHFNSMIQFIPLSCLVKGGRRSK